MSGMDDWQDRENQRMREHVPGEDTISRLSREIERLQRIIDSRPAINAALPESYIVWSQSIYELEFFRSSGQHRGR